MTEALLLGFSSGSFCLMACLPVMLPYVFGNEIGSIAKNTRYIIIFLLSRLAGYVITGLVLGYAGSLVVHYVDPQVEYQLFRVAYGLSGVLLLAAGVTRQWPTLGFCRLFHRVERPEWMLMLLGLSTGLSICPPFVTAAIKAVAIGSPIQSAGYFALFFVGTSVYLLPLIGISVLKRYQNTLNHVARYTMLLLGLYFLIFLAVLGF